MERPPYAMSVAQSSIKLSDAPTDSPQGEVGASSAIIPPMEPPLPAISDLKLPNWLKLYLDWAGRTGNQTPMSFHLAAGLWLLSVAVGRRLYGEAAWGINIYTNLYLMLIADTTYYRKSTAYKLAEQIARAAIPHLLMPTPGSPERFQEALSGKLPHNFKDLTDEQKQRLRQAQPFAAQRGLLKDEIAGLFGSLNKRDYMTGMKDLLMELYDCPDYSDKETQAGLTVIEKGALALFGVTTPASLGAAITDAGWSNGLLIRFALLTPEPDYHERPSQQTFAPLPTTLVTGLRQLYEKLPLPQLQAPTLDAGEKWLPPTAIALEVQCWPECQAYSEQLRQLCNPQREVELDERLKGIYGRMHVQAFKIAALLAALDWAEGASNTTQPVLTLAHWETGKSIAELWRASAARLLRQLDRSGTAQQEHVLQRRIIEMFRRAGANGEKLYVVYKNLHVPARQARIAIEELVKAGILIPIRLGQAEGYLHKDFTPDVSP